jgi:hypothetical protein
MLVQLPNYSGSLHADVGVLRDHGIRDIKVTIDAVVSGLFGVSSPPTLEVAISRAEKTKFENIRRG